MRHEKDRVERFVTGLKLSLQKDLALCDLSSHAEALDKALKVEWVWNQLNSDPKKNDQEHTQQKNDRDKKKRPHQDAGNQEVKKEKVDPTSRSRFQGKCPKYRRQHELEEYPMIIGVCFHCKKLGHKAANCLEKL